MSEMFQSRRANLATWMAQNSIAVVIFEDAEGKRDPAVRYFSGHPGDAILAVAIDGRAILAPWDENMAKLLARVDIIIPYAKYERNTVKTVAGLVAEFDAPVGCRVEIPSRTPYPQFLRYVDALNQYDILCRENGSHAYTERLRAIKDPHEIECYRRVSKITDDIIDKIEKNMRNGSIQTETDVALFIERECRLAGCEGTGFSTLAAGPDRSFGIHCFPSYTGAAFPGKGLSILDFGVIWQGYTSDVTLTIAMGELTPAQNEQIALVEKAYKAALDLYRPGTPTKIPCTKVDEIFAKAKRAMPHALGHGIGLEAHEGPLIRSRTDNEWVFEPGMVTTLEPGLYDMASGGCRLENDILITETGNEVLTHSRIIRL